MSKITGGENTNKSFVIIGDNGLLRNGLLGTLSHLKFNDISNNIWISPFSINEKFTQKSPIIDLLIREKSKDVETYALTSRLCSIVDYKTTHVISNKLLLYENMNKYFPDLIKNGYLAKTLIFIAPYNDFSSLESIKIDDKNPVLLKPVVKGAMHGSGITIHTSVETVITRLKKIPYEKIIICEYLTKTMTIRAYNDENHYKFHLRTHMLVFPRWKNSKIGEKMNMCDSLEWFLLKDSKITTAEMPYVKNHYEDPRIHDTHNKSTHRLLLFPQDAHLICENIGFAEKIQQQMNFICEKLIDLLKPHIRPYNETIDAYCIMGLDFMILEGEKVVLLEVNYPSDYDPPEIRQDDPETESKYLKKKFTKYSNEFYEQITTKIIEPYFSNFKAY